MCDGTRSCARAVIVLALWIPSTLECSRAATHLSWRAEAHQRNLCRTCTKRTVHAKIMCYNQKTCQVGAEETVSQQFKSFACPLTPLILSSGPRVISGTTVSNAYLKQACDSRQPEPDIDIRVQDDCIVEIGDGGEKDHDKEKKGPGRLGPRPTDSRPSASRQGLWLPNPTPAVFS